MFKYSNVRIEYFDQFEMADTYARLILIHVRFLSICLHYLGQLVTPSDTLLFALLRLHGDILPPGLYKQRVTANRLHILMKGVVIRGIRN